MIDSTPRETFLNRFSELSCRDVVELEELSLMLDSIDGITSRSSDDELYFCFVMDGVAHAFLSMSVRGEEAAIYIEPNATRDFMKKHGLFPFEADQLMEGFKPFLSADLSQMSYPYGRKFYGNIDEILFGMDSFVEIVQGFIDTIFYHD